MYRVTRNNGGNLFWWYATKLIEIILVDFILAVGHRLITDMSYHWWSSSSFKLTVVCGGLTFPYHTGL